MQHIRNLVSKCLEKKIVFKPTLSLIFSPGENQCFILTQSSQLEVRNRKWTESGLAGCTSRSLHGVIADWYVLPSTHIHILPHVLVLLTHFNLFCFDFNLSILFSCQIIGKTIGLGLFWSGISSDALIVLVSFISLSSILIMLSNVVIYNHLQ